MSYRLIKYTGLLLITSLLSSSCSKTMLDFVIDEPGDNKAPATYNFTLGENNCDFIEWDFGNGISSTDSITQQTYYLSGNYEITLKGHRKKKIKEVKKEIFVGAPEKCLIKIETPFGIMIAELFDSTPKHRDNFIKLAEEGYFDNLLFHRIINNFMVQGGDPNSRDADMSVHLGAGGPGYQIDAEFTPAHAHVKGALAAARIGGPANPQKKSSGSQFYIVHGRDVAESTLQQNEARFGFNYPEAVRQEYLSVGGTPFLDQEYTVFGKVIEGLEVIDKLASVDTNPSDRPLENVAMKISVIK